MTSMIDHVTLAVTDLDRARRFYEAAFRPLGIVPGEANGRTASFQRDGRDDFTLISAVDVPNAPSQTHHAFRAPSRAAVRAFHDAALGAGGADDGAPGLRPEYGSDYYAAFVRDPEGNRIEAVVLGPELEPEER